MLRKCVNLRSSEELGIEWDLKAGKHLEIPTEERLFWEGQRLQVRGETTRLRGGDATRGPASHLSRKGKVPQSCVLSRGLS